MSFAFPLAFLLLPLPFLARYLLEPRGSTIAAFDVPGDMFDTIRKGREGGRRRSMWLPLAAWLALVIALAGPRLPASTDILTSSGREIMLALDLSGSMVNEDFVLDGAPLSRLDAVKQVGAAFVAARRGDRIGLVVFGDRAYVAQPPTFDVDAVARSIEAAQIGISGRSTAIADGLGLALKRLIISDATTKVVVLLSDGVDTTGRVQAVDAARLAAENGVRVHTIALGPADLETQPASRDAVDAAGLRAMAEAAGGTSFRVRNMQDLMEMARTLDDLEANPMKRPPMQYWRSLWIWPAGLALALLVMLSVTRRA